MGFKLRSGNGPLPFKQMGSSPAKEINIEEEPSADWWESSPGVDKDKMDLTPREKKIRRQTKRKAKPETVASKIGKGVKKGVKATGEAIKKGAGALSKGLKNITEDNARNTRIADTLEYLFLEGKRPSERVRERSIEERKLAAQSARDKNTAAYYDYLMKPKGKSQNINTDYIDPNTENINRMGPHPSWDEDGDGTPDLLRRFDQ